MHALIFRMLAEGCLELVEVHVLQALVRNSIVQQGDVLRNGDTLVSRHILISQFKTGVQDFLTGSLLDRQRGIVIEYPRYGCRGESSPFCNLPDCSHENLPPLGRRKLNKFSDKFIMFHFRNS